MKISIISLSLRMQRTNSSLFETFPNNSITYTLKTIGDGRPGAFFYVNTNDIITELGISSGDNVKFHIKATSSVSNSKGYLWVNDYNSDIVWKSNEITGTQTSTISTVNFALSSNKTIRLGFLFDVLNAALDTTITVYEMYVTNSSGTQKYYKLNHHLCF